VDVKKHKKKNVYFLNQDRLEHITLLRDIMLDGEILVMKT